MNSRVSCVRLALCLSHCHRRVSSSISASLAADETTSAEASGAFSFLGEANSSSLSSGCGRGRRPSAAILATSSFCASVLKASRSCSTTLMRCTACCSCSWRAASWCLAVKASCSLAWVLSFSRSRTSSTDRAEVFVVLSSSCSLTMEDCDLNVSLRARRISFSQRACVCANVSFARP